MNPFEYGRTLASSDPGLRKEEVLARAIAAGIWESDASLTWMGYCSRVGRIQVICTLGPHNARLPSPPTEPPQQQMSPRRQRRWLNLGRLLLQRLGLTPGRNVGRVDG